MSHPVRTWGKALIDFFASLRLTITLLIVLSITSIFGTVIPQGDVPHEYLHGISQAKLKLYQSLNLFDMYHSWWFIGILSLFTVNLIVCSAKRLPHVWRYISSPAKVLDQALLDGLSQRLVIPQNSELIRHDSLQNLLGQKFGPVTVTETDDAVHLFSERNSLSRLAVYVTHLSIIIIFIGAIIGSLFGYKGFVTIIEKDKVSTVQTRSGKTVDLGFSVRCEDFSVTHYPNGAPKEFKSILTVVGKGGESVYGYTRIPVIVNDPLNYKGITFYQSSYGEIGEHAFVLSEPDGSNPRPLTLKSGGSEQLADGSTISLLEATADISQFQPGMTGPAAQVEVRLPNGANKTFVVYGTNASMNRMNLPYTGGRLLQYRGGEEFEYTGLQVTKDPGVWIVWIGCIMMILGIYGAFLMSHRRIWIRITDTEIAVAGHANKNQAAFAAAFEEFAEEVRRHISREEKQ
jgi:cytochrome c biogenesis protein